jgi:hypothetical protein
MLMFPTSNLGSEAVVSLPSEAGHSFTSVPVNCESLAMAATAHRNARTIDHVIETTQRTLNEYENASQRLDLVANVLLRPVGRNLDRVKERLESVEDDEEILERLENIEIGGEAAPLLNALYEDMSVVCAYLQNVTSQLREAEVDGYVQALGQYANLLKVVLSRSKK